MIARCTFGAVGLILLAVALLASYLPARRAARLSPVLALRYEYRAAQRRRRAGHAAGQERLAADALRGDQAPIGGHDPEARAQAPLEQLAWIEDLAFQNGLIEVEIAGAPARGAGEGARGFVGVAFRLQNDKQTYDAFYLRPTNGRADDQDRRNHSAQYVSHPGQVPSRTSGI